MYDVKIQIYVLDDLFAKQIRYRDWIWINYLRCFRHKFLHVKIQTKSFRRNKVVSMDDDSVGRWFIIQGETLILRSSCKLEEVIYFTQYSIFHLMN